MALTLRAYRDYRGLFEDWAHWAPLDAAGPEVDFLLRKGGRFVAVEAKARRSVGASDVPGLRAIAELRGVLRRVVVYLGDRRLSIADGVEVLPVGDFLRELEAGTLVPART